MMMASAPVEALYSTRRSIRDDSSASSAVPRLRSRYSEPSSRWATSAPDHPPVERGLRRGNGVHEGVDGPDSIAPLPRHRCAPLPSRIPD